CILSPRGGRGRGDGGRRRLAALIGRARLRGGGERRGGPRIIRGRSACGGRGARRAALALEALDAREQGGSRAVQRRARRLYERELEAGARVGARAHRLHRVAEQLEQPHGGG